MRCVVLALALVCSACGGGGAQTQTSPTPTASPAPAPTSTPTTTIGGRVFNTQNNDPIAGATVEVVSTELKTTTDGEGLYKIEGIKETTFTVRYTYATFQPAERNFTQRLGNQLTDINVGLTPTTTIAGRVFNTLNDNPIADAAVEVVGTDLKTTTDGEGRYRLSGIQTTSFTVRYTYLNYPSVERNFTQRLGNELTDINVGLTPTTTITIYGGVYYGSPFSAIVVPGALVEVTSPEKCQGLRTTTNGNGLYRLERIPCSNFRVRFSHPNYGDQNYNVGRPPGEWSFEFNILFTHRQ